MTVRMQASGQRPLVDSLTLQPLLDKHSVQVELLTEKKGLPFLKHVQYQITTKRFKLPVHKRYSDFDMFHELLLQRFSYRTVPQLPPKRMLKGVLTSQSEREFIESRRRGLERFTALVTQHPFLGQDKMVDIFLCAGSEDVQQKLRESFKKRGDEFLTNQIAAQAKEYLPTDIQIQITSNREFIGNILSSFQRLRDRLDRMNQRSHDHAADLVLFSKELSVLGCDPSPVPEVEGVGGRWRTQRQRLRGLSQDVMTLANRAAQQGGREEEDVLEKLNLFMDLLHSYKELCDRHERSMLVDHQKALLQKPAATRRHAASTAAPTHTPAKEQRSAQQLESRLTQQENAIVTMELRNYFSLLCLHQETQLILSQLPLTTHILACFIQAQAQGHTEMGAMWSELGAALLHSQPQPKSNAQSQSSGPVHLQTLLTDTQSQSQSQFQPSPSPSPIPSPGPSPHVPHFPRPPSSPGLQPVSPRLPTGPTDDATRASDTSFP
ncbi:sorting nexin-8-like [Centroberyx gerrardi]